MVGPTQATFEDAASGVGTEHGCTVRTATFASVCLERVGECLFSKAVTFRVMKVQWDWGVRSTVVPVQYRSHRGRDWGVKFLSHMQCRVLYGYDEKSNKKCGLSKSKKTGIPGFQNSWGLMICITAHEPLREPAWQDWWPCSLAFTANNERYCCVMMRGMGWLLFCKISSLTVPGLIRGALPSRLEISTGSCSWLVFSAKAAVAVTLQVERKLSKPAHD